MWTARKRLYGKDKNLPSKARLELARAHAAIADRYELTMTSPIWVWHSWRAAQNAHTALRHVVGLGFEEWEVACRILLTSPKVLGGNEEKAEALLLRALSWVPINEPFDEMLPSTRALMLCLLGDLELKRGKKAKGWRYYSEALNLRKEIEKEASPERERRLARILSSAGFFFLESQVMGYAHAEKLIWDSYWIAASVSEYERQKYYDQAAARGLKLGERRKKRKWNEV
jgi:hypothetical protein